MRRLDCDTADWHVFARGARRLRLFRDDQDHGQFLNYLAYGLRMSGCTLWAFALMSNHYHLVLRGTSAQLTSCMRRADMMYSRYHNRKYSLDGHTFDGPYQAFRQPTPLLMLHTIAYVLFNPVKGGLCQLPEEYPWSSARDYLGVQGSPLHVDVSALISVVDPNLKRAWQHFHEAMAQQARKPPRPSFGRPTMLELHREQFEWLQAHAHKMSDRLEGIDPTIVAMHWARQVGITPKAIANALGKSTTATIRVQLCKFRKRLEQDPGLNARLAL